MTLFIPRFSLSGIHHVIPILIHHFHSFKFSKSLIVGLLIMVVVSVDGATYNATKNGNWNAGSTWSTSGFPQSGDIVNIGNYTITLTTDAACNTFNSSSTWGIILGNNNLSISGNLTFGCAYGTITTTGGYLILNGTVQTINLCTGGGNSIPNLRLTNNTAVTFGPQQNLTITGNFDCQTGSCSITNNNYAGWGSGSLIITGNCIAPNCTFIAGTDINGTAFDFSSSTSNSIQIGSIIDNFPNAKIKFGTNQNVTTTTPFTVSNPSPVIGGTIVSLPPKLYLSNVTSGDWNSTSTWKQSTDGGNTWSEPATTIPTNADGLVTIQPGHTITVSNNHTASNLIVNGLVTITGTHTLTPDNASVIGTITVQNTAQNITQNTAQLIAGTGVIKFNGGSTYNHARDGGTIPTANWDSNSNCYISGILDTEPNGDGQTFGNLIYDCSNMTGTSRSMANSSLGLVIDGDFIVKNTGTAQLRMNQSILTVKRNCIINSNFRIGSGTNRTLNVGGNFSLTGGNVVMTDGDHTGTINVAGNFTILTGGTLTENGTASGAINFNGSTPQIYTSGGIISNIINFTVNSGATLQMADNTTVVSGGGTFTMMPATITPEPLQAATLGITSKDGIAITSSGALGNIQVTGIRTYVSGGNYIYNNSNAQQVTGNGLIQNTPSSLTINNSAGVTLSATTTISGLLSMTNGTLNMANSNLSVGSFTGSGNLTHSSGTAGARTLTIGSDGTSPAAYSGVISNGTSTSLALTKTGNSTVILSGANTYQGATTISNGELRLNPAANTTLASPIVLIDGTLSTLGITSTRTITTSTLQLNANSYINLETNNHSLTFAPSNSVTWTNGTTLTIAGWNGDYNKTTGISGKIFVGTNSNGLTGTQLSQIMFYNGLNNYAAAILSTGEVVPTSNKVLVLNYPSPNTFIQNITIKPLSPTINFSPTSYSVSPLLPDGLSLNTTTGVISGTPTALKVSTIYTVTASDGTGTASFVISITTRASGNYFSRANGNWDSNITWSSTSGGNAVGVGINPLDGDYVTIEGGHNVTVNSDAASKSITFTNNLATSLMINSAFTLNVSGAITIPRPETNLNQIIVGAGILNAGSISFSNGGGTNRHQITISTGTVNVTGNVVGGNTSGTILITDAGLLRLGGAFFNSGNGTLTTHTGSTVEYYSTIAQIVGNFKYDNLTLSGNGAKTTTGAIVDGFLSMEGTATTTGLIATYTGSTTLQYKGTSTQTTGLEFPTTFVDSGGVIINNNNGVILGASKTIGTTSKLTLKNGILTTISTKLLSLTNTATTAITGGSPTSFVNGPLNWSLPPGLLSGTTYNFPVGKGTTFLPFSLVNPTTGTGTVTAQVEAIIGSSGGTGNIDATLNSKSDTELWQLTTTGNFTNTSVSITRPSAIRPYNVIASSNTLNGNYTTLSGTFDTYGVAGSDVTTIPTNKFFVLASGKTPTVNVSTTLLYGFNYQELNGPSNELSFKVSGIGLTGDIAITPSSTDFEISILSGGIFQTTPITLNQVTGQVSATIYVRLRAGLKVGNYNSMISIISTLPTKNINCFGSVVPIITVGGEGSYCSTESINLTSLSAVNCNNIYWEGPGEYLVSLNNPNADIAIPFNLNVSIHPPVAGVYKATASYVSGPNLVLNGDFTQGKDKFNTGYLPFTTQNMSESHYAIVPFPSDVHSGFCSDCGDHTGSGGNQMVVNGAVTPKIIWQPITSISVEQYTDYQFTYWIQTVDVNDQYPSITQLKVNGINAGPQYTASVVQGSWTRFLYNWNSGSSTTANLILMSENTVGGGNDFALDDIVFQKVYTSSATVNVTVNPVGTPVNVSITASPGNNVNSQTNVTFNATPTNGGINPTYLWKVNNINVVASGSIYMYIPSDKDVITCTITSNSNSTCNPGPLMVTSNSIIMSVTTGTNYWKGGSTGLKATDWNTASNWTLGSIPSNADNINFDLAPNCDLYLDRDRTIGSLTNKSTKCLVIPPAKCLTINGKINTNNDYNRLYIQAYPDGSQQNGSLIFYDKSAVYGTVEMYSKGHYDDPGKEYNNTIYKYSWQYFGIPLESVKADPTFYDSFVRSWDESKKIDSHWVQLRNSDILKPFYGYEITQNVKVGKKITYQGRLVNWDWSPELALLKTTGAGFPGQHIFANPYTAAIDIKKFLSRNSTIDTNGSVYLYSTGSTGDWGSTGGEGNTDGKGAGQYQVVTQASAIGLPTQIPSMQAFLIKLETGSLPNSKISFQYSDVVRNNELQRIKSSDELNNSDSVYTMVDVTGSMYSDRMWIFSSPTFSRNFDKGWDGSKMFGIALAPQLYAIEPDGIYQINCVNDMNNTELGFQRGIDSDYTFTFTHENTSSLYSGIFLLDLLENKTIDITESGSTYSFVAESTPASVKRFMIATRSYEKDTPDAESQLKVFTSGNTVFVQNLSNQNGEMVVYDMMGRNLKSAKFDPLGITAIHVGNISGAYVVKAATGNERVSKQIILGK